MRCREPLVSGGTTLPACVHAVAVVRFACASYPRTECVRDVEGALEPPFLPEQLLWAKDEGAALTVRAVVCPPGEEGRRERWRETPSMWPRMPGRRSSWGCPQGPLGGARSRVQPETG